MSTKADHYVNPRLNMAHQRSSVLCTFPAIQVIVEAKNVFFQTLDGRKRALKIRHACVETQVLETLALRGAH